MADGVSKVSDARGGLSPPPHVRFDEVVQQREFTVVDDPDVGSGSGRLVPDAVRATRSSR